MKIDFSEIHKTIQAYYTPEFFRHIKAATSDLYNGPHRASHFRDQYEDETLEDYSFVGSCRFLSDWFNELDLPEYIDEDGFPVGDAESVDYYNEHGIPYYELNKNDLKREVFDDLAPYINRYH